MKDGNINNLAAIHSTPAARIKMLEASVRCLTFGLLGLLPFIGMGFGLLAVWYSGRAKAVEKYQWNPARSYRITGLVCAAITALAWGVAFCLLLWHLLDP